MKLVNQEVELLPNITNTEMVRNIAFAARNCYNSYDRNKTVEDEEKFIKGLITRGHESPLEFGQIQARIVCSRYTLAQLTRHRLASFCTMSQRYCNHSKMPEGIPFIIPADVPAIDEEYYVELFEMAEQHYMKLLDKYKPETARGVLPECTATQIVISANVREWRHIFRMRVDKHAQTDIRLLMADLLKQCYKKYPCLFEDLANELLTE